MSELRTRNIPAPGIDPQTTLPKLLAGLAEQHGDTRIALQEKRYGIWQGITWRGYQQRVRDFAHGLAALGVRPGEVVAVLGDNRPEWLIAELATQSIGACVVGIYPTSVGDEVVHILNHAGVRVVVAEDQEQVDKILDLSKRLKTVKHVVYYDPHGLEHYRQPSLVQFASVESSGRDYERDHPGWLDQQIAAGSRDDIAVICTTSGTTGKPKLAMLSHANLLSMGRSLMEVDPIGLDCRYLSFLPLAWIGEQMLAVACGLQTGMTLSFCEAPSTTKSDLREIGPDVLFSPPRIWEDMVSSVQVRIGDAGWLKRAVFDWAHHVGESTAEDLVRGRSPGGLARIVHRLADWIALRPVRDQLGLTRIRRAYTGGAPLGPDVFRFFHAIGVNLKQIYGQTEICGIAVTHRDRAIKFSSVGQPIPGTELKIADNGEILLRSDAVFHGYYRDEKSSKAAVDSGGWLHTGDAGYLDDDGQLIVIDRAKDVMTLPDGTQFSPAFIENKLKFSPYVEEAVAFGGDRPYISAIITLDPNTTGTWAERSHLSYTTYTDLSQKHEVHDLIAAVVARVNEELPIGMQVRRFVVLHKQLDPDDDEITRTKKVRRRVIAKRYGEIIEALYTDVESLTVQGTVTYQDGSTAQRDIFLRIVSMDGFTATARKNGIAGSVRS